MTSSARGYAHDGTDGVPAAAAAQASADTYALVAVLLLLIGLRLVVPQRGE